MAERSREAVAPAYLLLCLVLGGSVQGIWANMLLQLLGLAIIAWAAGSRPEPLAPGSRQLLLLAACGVAIVVVQLIPLPASIWPGLGGRRWLASDYSALGIAVPALPISLAPYKSLDALFSLIPPLALFCAMVRLKAYRPGWMAAALFVGMVLGVLLGALQVGSAEATISPWYLYPETTFGSGVGFFANANHMGTLLVISLPFLAAVVASARGTGGQRYSAIVAGAVGMAVVAIVGIALNGSLAAYGLALPVALASALILVSQRSPIRPWAVAASVLMLVAAVGVLATSSTGSLWMRAQQNTASVQSREEMLETTSRAIVDYMPFGTGLGSFRDVYHLYEGPGAVTPTYVVHSHDDYAELALELGLAGIVLMLAFLAWWARAVWRVWSSAEVSPYARAASIASAAILAHSIVDFPLRTAAIACCFAMCLAFLSDRRGSPARRDASDLRPTRHLILR